MPKSPLLLLLALLVVLQPGQAQPLQSAPSATHLESPFSAAPPSSVLDGYIRLGLDSNLALHQRNFDLQKVRLDLQRAKSQFYPQATFSSQYTLANGGRSEDIPIGDLLNGVYSTLNQLTGSNKFPQVANQSIQFLPNDFQDTKMEISLPLINTDLQHNREVNSERIHASQADVTIYRRELVRSIRQAYYQYLQAGKAVEIYGTALLLVKENRRVSQKFVENHMATREIVLRSQAQVSQVESSLIEAQNNLRNAAAYFNFLLNRSLDSAVQADPTLMSIPAGSITAAKDPSGTAPLPGTSATPSLAGTPSTPSFPGTPPASSFSAALPANREEFSRLTSYQHIMASNLKWDRAYLVPRLNAFYDIGFQGFGLHFNSSQFYQLAGVQLIWPLFRANDNKYKIRQAVIDIQSINEQYQQLTEQLTLEQTTTLNNYGSALEALRSLDDEVGSARETYRLAEKRFDEGQALQIELIDARSQMTNAELRYSLGRLNVLNRAADLERVTASYKF